jgi:hypothetical protein
MRKMSQDPTYKHIHNLEVFEANLNQLGDKELIEQLKQLFAREKKLGDAIYLICKRSMRGDCMQAKAIRACLICWCNFLD